MTISRVVNGQSGVGKKLRTKILKAMGRSDYVPDYIASGLRTRVTSVMGLVIPDVSCSYFSEMAKVIQGRARKAGYSTILSHSDESYEVECVEINLLRGFRVSGLIIAPSGDQDDVDIYRRLQTYRLPFVFIDRMKKHVDCSYVLTDETKGALLLGNYLISKGYRRWGYLKGPKGVSSSEWHEAGLRQSLKESDGTSCSITSVRAGFMEEDGYRAAAKLLARYKPEVIVAVNDLAAIGALRYLKEKNIRVPKDIALAGFSDLASVDLLEVPLTTVREPFAEIGKRAIEILLQEIAEPGHAKQKVAMAPELVVRESA